MKYSTELQGIIEETSWLMKSLEYLKTIETVPFYIGAGSIRNTVWDYLHGAASKNPLSDIDVIFYDDSNLIEDSFIREKLLYFNGDYDWEVVNQANVHVWYEKYFGVKLHKLKNIDDAVSIWPETATAVAVRLDSNGKLDVIAPFGLSDLFELRVVWNNRVVPKEEYIRRINEKGYAKKWNMIKIEIPS